MSDDHSIGPARKLQLAKNAAADVADDFFEKNWPLDTDEKYSQYEALESVAASALAEFKEFIRPKGPSSGR
ncbi:hypothetical protein K2E96_16455 [Pseudomonas sp. ERGC3:05]|nr:hypothetical protein [Pseudomonas sp. ERGC3:01]QZC92712.1 hypothetical protein K2E96_16455 [Pseudomonas sp. ERGC3:05]